MAALWTIPGTQSNNISVLELMVKHDITYVVRFLRIKELFTESQYAATFY